MREQYAPGHCMETVNTDCSDVAFDIGWDFARFGRCIDHSVADVTIIAGYRAGREHFRVPQHSPDRYTSKWLQLRINAFRRRRVLSEEVTPGYLKRIDCASCPITLI